MSSEKVTIEIEFDEELVQQLQELASELGISFDELMGQIAREELNRTR